MNALSIYDAVILAHGALTTTVFNALNPLLDAVGVI